MAGKSLLVKGLNLRDSVISTLLAAEGIGTAREVGRTGTISAGWNVFLHDPP